jgi:hypothetical protein
MEDAAMPQIDQTPRGGIHLLYFLNHVMTHNYASNNYRNNTFIKD